MSTDSLLVEVGEVPLLSKVLSAIPLFWFDVGYVVEPNEVGLVTHLGTLTNIQEQSGLHFDWPGGRDVRHVTMKQQTLQIPQEKITDSAGVPILVSSIVNYRVVDAKKAFFAVDDYKQYLAINAASVIKQEVASHSYDQLRSQTGDVIKNMTDRLQSEVDFTGILITTVALKELNYAPEIAAALLRKQQAGAMLEARELIVEGTVKIAQDCIDSLSTGDRAVEMSADDKAKLVTNLLTVMCSESDATPTVGM
jgi:regulator of protease activity HflC (stomatin/prohibitin superfamily)